MCELCDLKEQADKLRDRLQFRMHQMQVEIQEGRINEAQEAKRLARDALSDLIEVVWEHATEVRKGKKAEHGMSLADILGDKGPGFH